MVFAVVATVVGLSVVVDLFTGTAHLRGTSAVPRDQNPRGYWTAVLLKSAVALTTGAVGLYRHYR